MDLKEFVAETLAQIVAGVKAAQQADDGANVNAKMANVSGGNLIDGGNYGVATRVDFDVSVTAEAEGKGGGRLQVLNIVDVGASGSHRSSAANRVCFSVPVRLPNGDATRAEEVQSQIAARKGRIGANTGFV